MLTQQVLFEQKWVVVRSDAEAAMQRVGDVDLPVFDQFRQAAMSTAAQLATIWQHI
jgi:hypothetical protein